MELRILLLCISLTTSILGLRMLGSFNMTLSNYTELCQENASVSRTSKNLSLLVFMNAQQKNNNCEIIVTLDCNITGTKINHFLAQVNSLNLSDFSNCTMNSHVSIAYMTNDTNCDTKTVIIKENENKTRIVITNDCHALIEKWIVSNNCNTMLLDYSEACQMGFCPKIDE